MRQVSSFSLPRLIARELGRPSAPTARLLNLANARVNREAVDLLEVSPDHHVIDVGFGGGAALGRLAQRAAFVAGIDRSPAAVRSARKRYRRQIEDGRMRVEEASVERIPFDSATFDRALTVHTIYFWPDPERGLREILRVVKPGGRLVLATDTRGAPEAIARHGFTDRPQEEQDRLLAGAGFSDIRFVVRGRLMYAVASRS